MADTVQKPEVQTGISAISPERVERAIMLRYSPLPDLSMATITAQLNQFRVGELRQAARTWEIMMERDGDLAVPAEKLFSDIARLPWEIEKEDDSKEADQDYEFLKYFYTNLTASSVLEQSETGGLNLLLRQMMTAHAFRYSAHEMVLQVNSASKREVTAQFNHCPVWFFENRKGRLAFLPSEADINGVPCEPGRWLTAVGKGYMRQCAIAYFCKWGPLADWMFFAKRFGIPGIHGETTAQKDSTEWNDFADALQAFANGWIIQTSGLGNSKVTLVEAAKGAGSTLPFAELIERSDRVYARCFRGGDLSTQSREGSDVAGANPQESEKRIVLEDGGQWATDILNARVDEPMIAYAFNRRPKAWICIRPPKASDATREINSLKAARELGIPISIETARERLELPAPEDGEELIAPPAPPPPPFGTFGSIGNRQSAIGNEEALENATSAEAQFVAAVAGQINPVLATLDRITQIKDDAQMLAALQNFLNSYDRFAALATADVARVQAALEKLTARSLSAGLQGKKP
jgi:phage gp29-like protein